MKNIKRIISVALAFALMLSLATNALASGKKVTKGVTTIAGVQYEYSTLESGDTSTTTVTGGGETSTVVINKKTYNVIDVEQNGQKLIENGLIKQSPNQTIEQNVTPQSQYQMNRPPYWDRNYQCYSIEVIEITPGGGTIIYDWCAVEGELNQYKKIWGGATFSRPSQMRPFIYAIDDMSNAQASAIAAAGGTLALAVVGVLAALSEITAGISLIIGIFVGIGMYAAAAPYIDAAERARLRAQDAWYDITGWHA